MSEPALVIAQPLPGPARGKGYLYVVEFSTGVIKVGMTTNPKHRLQGHSANAGRFGASVSRRWVSQPHGNYVANERSLIRWAMDHQQGRNHSGAEYFAGIDFAAVVAFADALPSQLPRLRESSPDELTTAARRLVDANYVHELTGYSPQTIRKMAREGRIPAIRHGRAIRFDPDALDKWLAKLPKAST